MTKTDSLPNLPPFTISRVFHASLPVVALESTVITHGLPRPQNFHLALEIEKTVRENGATPATIAILDGIIRIGLKVEEIERLSKAENVKKVSIRDFAGVIMNKECGGTTVAGTIVIANQAGIKVFATGGIGGVHEVETLDISTDLHALANIPIIVVCAGAKAILDISATLEYLETMGIPVIGYRTDEFPAFYSRQSGLPVSIRLDTPQEIVEFAQTHWKIGFKSAVLVCQPLPPELEIPRNKIDGFIQLVRTEARKKGIRGQSLTPFQLARMVELTGSDSLRANKELLFNNARLGAQIAVAFAQAEKQKVI